MGFEREYYDQARLWEMDFSALPAERERIGVTIALIPPDVKTILDVGCGNGAFLHALPPTYEAMGVDSSLEALKHVKAVVYGAYKLWKGYLPLLPLCVCSAGTRSVQVIDFYRVHLRAGDTCV